MGISVEVDVSALTEKLSPQKMTMVKQKGLEYASEEMLRILIRNSPVDHGVLKGWAVTSRTDDSITIQSPAAYARWVNDGHPQQPGRFIPGVWNGDKFEYIPKNKTGMVLKASHVEGKHFVEDSISDVEGRLDGYFLKAISEVFG